MSTQRDTKVINIVSGPGCGKTVTAALLFAELKMLGYTVEYVPEYAKRLIWLSEWDTLNNQHYVSTEQYKLLKSMMGHVDYIVTDGSLLHGLYYNKTNLDNTSDVLRTHRRILSYYKQFNNINLFLTRGSFKYETAGRQQTEDEARQIDIELQKILIDENIRYTRFTSDRSAVGDMVSHILATPERDLARDVSDV